MTIQIITLPLHHNQKQIVMTTLKNTTGSKIVNITKDASGTFRAIHCQVYNNEQSVIQ